MRMTRRTTTRWMRTSGRDPETKKVFRWGVEIRRQIWTDKGDLRKGRQSLTSSIGTQGMRTHLFRTCITTMSKIHDLEHDRIMTVSLKQRFSFCLLIGKSG